jgi:hypothetical protein
MANIALNRPADASSFVNPYIPAKAVDGVVTPLTRWLGSSPLPPAPATPAPVWLRVDLGTTYWVNRWVVKQMGSLGWSPNFNLTDYKLQGSTDSTNWFDMDTVTNNSANQTDRTFTGKKARWLRLYITKGLRCNTNFASVADFEAYEAANSPYLSGFTLQHGTVNVPYSPLFSSKVYSYTANVGTDVGSITVTPTAAQGLVIRVNNNVVQSGQPSAQISLNSSSTIINVTVTSPDGTMTDIYTIVVSKAVKSAFLSALALNARGASMSPGFDSTTYNYNATVAPNADTGTVTATAEDTAATVKVNGVTVPSGTPSQSIPLTAGGVTNITIDVTAADNSDTKHYRIAVTRP